MKVFIGRWLIAWGRNYFQLTAMGKSRPFDVLLIGGQFWPPRAYGHGPRPLDYVDSLYGSGQ